MIREPLENLRARKEVVALPKEKLVHYFEV